MLKNYTPRTSHVLEEHQLIFYYDDNGGFGFPCDAAGNVCVSALSDCAMHNLSECMAHPERFQHYAEVRTSRRRIIDHAHGVCECGKTVYLYDQYMGACECECGRWYNLFGQELLPPTGWEDDYDY